MELTKGNKTFKMELFELYSDDKKSKYSSNPTKDKLPKLSCPIQ